MKLIRGCNFSNILLVFISIILFLNIPLYLYISGIVGFSHVYYIAGVILISTLLLFYEKNINSDIYVIYYVLLLAFVYAISYVMHDDRRDGDSIFYTDMARIALFISLYLLINEKNKLDIVNRVVAFCVIVATIINIYHFLNPLGMGINEFSIIGRASGFYVNPNEAGYAIVIGSIICYKFISVRFREFFVLFSGIGVLLTFSRAAILMYLVFFFIIYIRSSVSRPRMLFLVSISVLVAPIIIDFALYKMFNQSLELSNVFSRINWFASAGSSVDYSISERLSVVIKSMNFIDESPLIGYGNGELSSWSVLPHNIYLYNSLRFGVIGFFLYPLFLIVVTYRQLAEGDLNAILWVFAMAFFGLFSHNVMESYFLIFAAAYMAARNRLLCGTVSERRHSHFPLASSQ